MSRVLRFFIVGASIVCAVVACAQQPGAAAKANFAAVSNIRLEHNKAGSTLEITATRPVVPQISEIDSPPRIVIDLPNSRVAVRTKRINVQADHIAAIRVDQFQERPPVTRVVVDLLAPHKFHWSASGNVLLVTLEPTVVAAPEPERTPAVTGLREGAEPVAVPVSSGSSGAVMLAGSGLAAGSTVTAGGEMARLQLARGGEVRVCPGTTVSVTPSQNGLDLMLALNTGAIETHYRLAASADSVLTPDFRIQFPGPGEFHFAISSDSRGNTCVRSLMGNTASAVVSELMGDRTYQVKPTDQLVFHAGSLDRVDSTVPLECGCPPAATPVMRAEAPAVVVPDSQLPASTRLASRDEKPVAPPPDGATLQVSDLSSRQTELGAETAPLPPSKKEDIHVRIDAPIVFRASELPQAAGPAQKQGSAAVATANTVQKSNPTAPLPKAAEPTTVTIAKAEHRGFFRKIGGFFAAIFR
jgi:hypothetical protein